MSHLVNPSFIASKFYGVDMVGVGDNVIYVTKEGAMAVEVGSTKGEAVDVSHE